MSAGSINWATVIDDVEEASAHWLPLKIAENNVSQEMASKLQRAQNTERSGEETSVTIRGRELKGHRYELPKDYYAFSLVQVADQNVGRGQLEDDSDQMAASYNDTTDMVDDQSAHWEQERLSRHHEVRGKSWKAKHRTGSIMLWGHDVAPSKTDAGRRCLDFLSVAQKVHAPISKEAVEAQLRILEASS
ncbi:hypothetical protein CEUSTIGMA_g1937.t1 [Chlamydomonas eustigma]|uniref:Uncharacterized protein n=1 Tax=Chlamydomonas eustigma TaxID=1157962 RepID=A0A250WUI7_9CHLO|nr:hypothetical protein CEUSTIGMA_g1937.t1 [Chlamydomonas eustigma]|eukprot:GAX74488.1 hypothetical protein CEUSTIGMA_g1937.t1 [Chlamydomonas eustigma]